MSIERSNQPEQTSRPPGAAVAAETAPGVDVGATTGLGTAFGTGQPNLGKAQLLRLQRTLGNRHVRRLVQARRAAPAGAPQRTWAVQRVNIDAGTMHETLYSGTGGTANNFSPERFSQTARYQMTRGTAPANALVNVRIKFVNAAPAPDGSRDGVTSAIPASDPRRGFATTMCAQLVGHWNNKFVLVGRRRPAASGGTGGGTAPAPSSTPAPAPAPAPAVTPAAAPAPPAAAGTTDPNEVRLPVVFQATPIFDVASTDVDTEVALYGPQTQAGGDTHPIDSGHWYMNRGGNYSASLSSIYAHEYGHLLGIPDEYSRSNHQMHLLMHRFSPSAATRNNRALDQATVKAMVLQALYPSLSGIITGQGAQLSAAFAGQRRTLTTQLSQALRQGLRTQTTVDALVARVNELFQGPEAASIRSALPRAAYFELFDNFSNMSIASEEVRRALSPAGISGMINNILLQVIRTASLVSIPNPTPGQPALEMRISSSTGTINQPALAGSSSTLATSMAGTATPGAAGAPPVYPSGTILGQLQSLASSWQASGANMGALVEESQLRERFMQATNPAIDENPMAGARSAGAVYRSLLRVVTAAARSAARGSVQELFSQAIRPTIEAQVNQVAGWVEAETQRHTTATGTGTTGSPGAPADPALMAAVQQMENTMRARLDAAQTAGATGQEEPGTTTTDQPVRYSVQGLMGDNNSGNNTVRPDMMGGSHTVDGTRMDNLATQFNNRLKQADEDDFQARPA